MQAGKRRQENRPLDHDSDRSIRRYFVCGRYPRAVAPDGGHLYVFRRGFEFSEITDLRLSECSDCQTATLRSVPACRARVLI